MVISEPKLSRELLATVDPNSKNYRDRPIKANFAGFEECFVMFHPFTKPQSVRLADSLHSNNQDCSNPSKTECLPTLSWTEFIKISGIKDYVELDAALAFAHRARTIARKSEYLKLRRAVAYHVPRIMLPGVDEFPEALEPQLYSYLLANGYTEVYIYDDSEAKADPTDLHHLLAERPELPSHVRIETPGREILIAQDFDQRFIYICGARDPIELLVAELALEGFFCGDRTPEGWSYSFIPEEDQITWGEDLKMII